MVPTLTLKPLSTTRWESRVEALKTLRFNLGKIYDALYSIYSDDKRDTDSKNLASSLISKLKSFKLICSLVIWYDILSKINIISKALQKSDVALSEAVKMISQIKDDLVKTRTESAFKEMISNAKTVAEEPISDPESNFKINFYYYLLDTAISKLDERFELLNENNMSFSFLQNINNWKNFNSEKKRMLCLNLQQKLSNGSESDIDGEDLFNELEILPTFVDDYTTPLNILNYLLSNSLVSAFPNLSTALRIYLTLPVTVGHSERSFSKLKLVKNYLRSAISQTRLTNLSIISIEHETRIEVSDIVRDFANAKARKVNCL